MLNRQRDEIVRDILQSAMGHPEGVGISMIMFRAYLSHTQARAYVTELVERHLLDNQMTGFGRNFYKTTPKGIEFLAAMSHLTEMLPVESMRRVKEISWQYVLELHRMKVEVPFIEATVERVLGSWDSILGYSYQCYRAKRPLLL